MNEYEVGQKIRVNKFFREMVTIGVLGKKWYDGDFSEVYTIWDVEADVVRVNERDFILRKKWIELVEEETSHE